MLQIKNLSKNYGTKKAVCNLSLVVEDGDIMGFIGKNGAGKTTTLKACLGTVSYTHLIPTIILTPPIRALP